MAIQASELINQWVQQEAFNNEVLAASIVLVDVDGAFITVSNLPQEVNAKLLAEVAVSLAEQDDEGGAA